jgi:hypothetical protein
MSTELLAVPEKVHELCDDLESLWFSLLYEALHFVKHNTPPLLDVDTIFDYISICPTTGAHNGGMGKAHLYRGHGRKLVTTIEFTNQPFTTLIWEMHSLFRSLFRYYDEQGGEIVALTQDNTAQDDTEQDNTVAKNIPKLKDCAEVKRIFKEALDSKGWSESCDKVEDQYPPNECLTPKEENTVALSHLESALGRSPCSDEPSGTKRKREENERESEGEGGSLDILPSPENKKPNTNPPWRRGASGRLVRI